MIRSLSAHGSIKRSIAVRRHSLFTGPLSHHRYALIAQTSVNWSHGRLLSSTPRGPSKPSEVLSEASSEKPLPPPRPKPKPKVELRPAPVKPPPSLSAAGPPPPPQVVPRPSEPPSVSKAELASAISRRDIIDNATQHGILTPPPPNSSLPKRYFHQFKELAKFYWRGVKMINAHRKHVFEIQQRIQNGGAPMTRWETRFIQTFRSDIVKVVPFVLTVIILEEIIPLIILYFPNALPSTCILPSQRLKIEAKKLERQMEVAMSMRAVFDEMRMSGKEQGWVSAGEGGRSTAICSLLMLSKMGTNGMRVSRIHRHLTRIAADDTLLRLEGFGTRLTEPELREALHERGIITTALSKSERISKLRWWLTTVDAQLQSGDPVSRRVFALAQSVAGY